MSRMPRFLLVRSFVVTSRRTGSRLARPDWALSVHNSTSNSVSSQFSFILLYWFIALMQLWWKWLGPCRNQRRSWNSQTPLSNYHRSVKRCVRWVWKWPRSVVIWSSSLHWPNLLLVRDHGRNDGRHAGYGCGWGARGRGRCRGWQSAIWTDKWQAGAGRRGGHRTASMCSILSFRSNF